MTSASTRVPCVLAMVAFVAALLTMGANMLLQPLLLETQLTYVVYGIAGGGIVGAIAAWVAGRSTGATRFALAAAGLNGALVLATFMSTTVLTALPPVDFEMDIGDTLPEFAIEPRALDGKAVRLADHRGKPVVVVFHRGGWCPFCQAELAGLNDHYDKLAPLATVLAISVDVPDAVRAYARARDLRFTLLHDEGAHVARQYGLTFKHPERGDIPVPAAIVLDGEGRIVWFHVARNVRERPDPEELMRILRSIS